MHGRGALQDVGPPEPVILGQNLWRSGIKAVFANPSVSANQAHDFRHVAHAEIETLGPDRRKDMRRLADQRDAVFGETRWRHDG